MGQQIGRPQRVIMVANFRRVGFESAIERLQSVTGVTNFRGIRQWKAPKCDMGREFEGCETVEGPKV